MKTCELLEVKTGKECGKPADFIIKYDNSGEEYFCKNCYRECRQISNELKIPWTNGTRITK